MVNSLGAVVMAAGAGRRMGYRPKGLLQRDGVSLIERTVRMLLDCGVAPVVVVLGHHAGAIEPLLRRLRDSLTDPAALQWAVNPAPDDGPGGSLRTGLATFAQAPDAVLVLLADQALLEQDDIHAMLAAWRHRPEGIHLVVPAHDGQPGHPLIFGPVVRERVAQGQGGAGLREWRRAHPDQVQLLPVEHLRYTRDVDTPDDLLRLATQWGVNLTWDPGFSE